MSMRAVKTAIAQALATDEDVSALVPAKQVFSTERATIPKLPSVEVVAIASSPQDTGPLLRHALSIEITVTNPTEDGADAELDSLVRACRERLSDAAQLVRPITRPDGEAVPVTLLATRWSVSAADASSIVRGAAVSVEVGSDDA